MTYSPSKHGYEELSMVHAAARERWEKAFGQIQVQTPQQNDKRIFYTALYHAIQHPRLFSDVDRTNPQFVRSLILKGQQGGWLPIFPAGTLIPLL